MDEETDSEKGNILLKVLQLINGRTRSLYSMPVVKIIIPVFYIYFNSSTKLCNNLFHIHFSFNSKKWFLYLKAHIYSVFII